ncbi:MULTISPECIES: hypothetical protein [Thermomonosporaceae]|uniref:hypothetical protein n=1 Tax=Thermomonosporaceae TaxID=2012 RepID=UPI00255A8706|nr:MULTISPECIES: hypothetical protein [Thermomonosporaceae]MDL4770628.1 hypothetical protein [Actinomadura xylanilytica]
MSTAPDVLEARITELRAAVRRAVSGGDRRAARELRAELRQAESDWDDAVLGEGAGGLSGADALEAGPEEAVHVRDTGSSGLGRGEAARPSGAGSAELSVVGDTRASGSSRRGMLPVREQVHQALTLLGAPAAPKLIGSVYSAFFPGEVAGTRLTSLRRDEERSFRTAPYARPYYLCAALTADLLAPARGMLTVSTWPLEQRIAGPLSPRTDFLTAAIRVAEHAGRGGARPAASVQRLLWRFASNIPGAATGTVGTVDPADLMEAARAELDVHREADARQRARAAERARAQLDDAERLFGSRLRAMRRAAGDGRAGGPGPAPGGPTASVRSATHGEDER